MLGIKRQSLIYYLPFMMLTTTYLAFHLFTGLFGQKAGYFSGFLFYWLFWCVAVPVMLIGKSATVHLFSAAKPLFGSKYKQNIIYLILPVIFVYSYEFPRALKQADTFIIAASVAIALVNATAEEILWRGTFLKLLGRNPKWYIPFSSVGFAIWHFAPLSVVGNHNPGGAFSFVAVSFILGLLYSAVTKNSKSILLVTISHILFDFSGLGARIYFL